MLGPWAHNFSIIGGQRLQKISADTPKCAHPNPSSPIMNNEILSYLELFDKKFVLVEFISF